MSNPLDTSKCRKNGDQIGLARFFLSTECRNYFKQDFLFLGASIAIDFQEPLNWATDLISTMIKPIV